MNKNIEQKWLEALRSGQYTQARHMLHNTEENSFCCLGVLCDLYCQDTGVEWEIKNGQGHLHDETGELPKQVMDWAGMNLGHDRGIPYVEVQGKHQYITSLTDINDNGTPFWRIANIIEQNTRPL